MTIDVNPETHSPSGFNHPEFILAYIRAFKKANPGQPIPQMWDRQNGWVNFDGLSYRRSMIIRMTEELERDG